MYGTDVGKVGGLIAGYADAREQIGLHFDVEEGSMAFSRPVFDVGNLF